MSMDYTDFDAQIAPQLHNSPLLLRSQTFWRVVRDFLRQTECYSSEWDFTAVVEREYEIPSDVDIEDLADIDSITVNGVLLDASNYEINADGNLLFGDGSIAENDEIVVTYDSTEWSFTATVESEYTPSIPDDTTIIRFDKVLVEDKEINKSLWSVTNDRTLLFDDNAGISVGDDVSVILVLNYTPAATELDDHLGEEHFDSLCDGTLAKMKAMFGKPWSDPSTAPYYHSQFISAINRAKRLKDQAHQGGDTIIVPRRFI